MQSESRTLERGSVSRNAERQRSRLRTCALAAACVLAAAVATLPARAKGGRCERVPYAVETVTSFVPGVEIPESVTVDARGILYVSVGATIRQITPEGQISDFGTLPLAIFALGVKVGPDGCVYTASTSLSDVPGAYVWRLCEAGSVEVFAELDHSGAPNDLAFDRHGNLFVTDPVLGRVWKLDSEGNPEVLVEGPLLEGDPEDPALLFRALGVNGIALDRRGHALYLSNTDQGSVVRVGLRSREREPTLFVQDPLLRGADGIAFDRTGALFVTINASDALAVVGRDRVVRLLPLTGELDAPSSVAFGTLHRDRHRLYVVSSAFSRTLGLQSGTPEPALVTLRSLAPGLLLP